MGSAKPIGVFDSGYGGLTVLRSLTDRLPEYDFLYLGDNARAPYGTRSFETVYTYTLEAVNWFFDQGCSLVILACNTASAKALRTIQQKDLPMLAPSKRVLGVIRPTTESIGKYTKTQHVGIFGTAGTVRSGSYPIEIERFFPDLKIFQVACPMWVPLIENFELQNPGSGYFVQKYVDELMSLSASIDTILLACTHYPILQNEIEEILKPDISVISQGSIVAEALYDYLNRHPEIDANCSKNGQSTFFTTDDPEVFSQKASFFYGQRIDAKLAVLSHVKMQDKVD